MSLLYKGKKVIISEEKYIKMFKKYEEAKQSDKLKKTLILDLDWISNEVPYDFISLFQGKYNAETILLSWRNFNQK
jgi:hypothetical protein